MLQGPFSSFPQIDEELNQPDSAHRENCCLIGGFSPTCLKNMIVKLDDFPNCRDENKKCLKPPTSVVFFRYKWFLMQRKKHKRHDVTWNTDWFMRGSLFLVAFGKNLASTMSGITQPSWRFPIAMNILNKKHWRGITRMTLQVDPLLLVGDTFHGKNKYSSHELVIKWFFGPKFWGFRERKGWCFSQRPKNLPSLKLTFSHLKMDGWNTRFLLG